jgi:DNA-binding transcriptional LysR family regulator
MKNINLRSVDLNLLTAFQSIYDHRSITKASASLGLTQPAVSHALGRLRTQFGDPLFLRIKSKMVPTPRAYQIAETLGDILRSIDDLVRGDHRFDPTTVERQVRIGVLDYGMARLAIRFASIIVREAPRLIVHFQNTSRSLAQRMVEDGELDFAIGPFGTVSPTFERATLISDDCVVVVRKKHPNIRRRPSLKVLCKSDHICVNDLQASDEQIDQELGRHGMHRHKVVFVPYFSSALFAVSNSDLVTIITRGPAQLYKKFLDINLFETPFDLPPQEISMIRHQRSVGDPLSDWLWDQIKRIWS